MRRYAPRPHPSRRPGQLARGLPRQMRRRSPRALRTLTYGAAIASALLAWLPAALGLGQAAPFLGCEPAYLPLIAVVLLLATRLDVSLPIARGEWQVGGVDMAGAALLLLCPGPGLWLATALASALLSVQVWRRNGRRWRSLDFTTSSALLQIALAATLTSALRYAGVVAMTAALAGLLLAALTRHTMAAAAVALTARRPLLGLLTPRLPIALVTAFGNGAVGLLIGWLVINAPLGLAGLAVPGVLVASTYEMQSRRSAEARLFAALATEQQRAAGRSLDQSVAVLLTVTARMLDGADIELLLSGPEGLIRYTGDESGVSGRARVDPSAFDAPWVRLLLARGAVRIAADEGRPACAFSVRSGSAPRAVVVARRPEGGSPFTRRDHVLAWALARQAPSWLTPTADSVASRDPRLEVVREIARRIQRAPEPNADPSWSSQLLDEVHALERAVAALLGSAPGGAIPAQRDRRAMREDAADGAEPSGLLDPAAEQPDIDDPLPSGAEWTTTGRMP